MYKRQVSVVCLSFVIMNKVEEHSILVDTYLLVRTTTQHSALTDSALQLPRKRFHVTNYSRNRINTSQTKDVKMAFQFTITRSLEIYF